jgi:hypothetical protein
MNDHGVTMLYTDRHAYMTQARWSADHADLAQLIDWDILQRHDFARSDEYPDKMERYQAEALAHRRVPAGALLGIGCVSDMVRGTIEADAQSVGSGVRVVVRPQWYF